MSKQKTVLTIVPSIGVQVNDVEHVRGPDQNREVALELAAAGIPIFPANLTKKGERWDKIPLIREWRENATTDQSQINEWWRDHPRAVPGIELSKLGLVVVDADRHGGPDGIAALKALVAEHGALPRGPVTESAGGGLHLYFRQPSGLRLGNRRGSLPPGIDFRGDGGWIVAPEAIRPDGRTWKPSIDSPKLIQAYSAGDIPLLPDWLIEQIETAKLDGQQTQAGSGNRASGRERAYAQGTLESCVDEVRRALPGGRNETLNAVAYRLGRVIARAWIEKSAIESALLAASHANGLLADDGPDRVLASIASGIQAGLRDPHDDLLLPAKSPTPANDNYINAAQRTIRLRWDGELKFEPPTWLVRELVTETAVGLFVGESQAGKSLIAVYLAVCIALGEPFFTKPTKRGGVLYVAAEAAATIYERLEAARLGFAIPTLTSWDVEDEGSIDPNKLAIAIAESIPDLARDAGAQELLLLCKEVANQMKERFALPLRAVVIDTLGASFAIDNWNDPSQARRIISVLNQIKNETGATVIGVHHHGKTIERGAAGSFVFQADPDFVLSIFREAELRGAVSERSLAVTKNRRGATGWTCNFELVPTQVGKDAEGVDVSCPYIVPQAETINVRQGKKGKGRGDGRALTAFKDATSEALIESGSDQAIFGDGPTLRAVPRFEVRREFDRRYTTDSVDAKKRDDAIRKAFDRALDQAVKSRWAREGSWGSKDWLWRAGDDS